MDARTFATIKNLIWDQLLATKATKAKATISIYFVYASQRMQEQFEIWKKVLTIF